MVGRKRRLQGGNYTPGGRLVHGRKGIGKLAAFGTANTLDCYSLRSGSELSFRLDYERIRRCQPDEECRIEEDVDKEPLLSPEDMPLSSGTRIRLSNLKLKRAISEGRFMKSMSRRFAIDQTDMQVSINGRQLQRFDMEVEYRFPQDGKPEGSKVIVGEDGWGTESLPDGKEVRWWIGFTPKPLEAEYLRGISILARNKMLQRPFMFERAQGVEGQLGQEYVVGEVSADWLDTGVDIEDDLVQTNRDQLQLEDERVQELLKWGRRRLDWALSQRLRRRRDRAEKTVEEPDIQDLLQDFTPTERHHLSEIANKASQIGDPDPASVRDFMAEVVNGFKDKAVRELMERVRVEESGFQSSFWGLVREFSLIDARRTLSIVRARLETIDRLDAAIKAGATEVPHIHETIKEFPWILDPRWSLLGDEVDISTFAEEYEPTVDGETGQVLDFLFILQPKDPAPADELLVVEIKRGRKSNGKIHSVSEPEVDKFYSYVLSVQDHYRSGNTSAPSVSGLMIANRYSQRAGRKRRSLESLQDVKLEFRTWDSVIDNTRKLHTGWLEVTQAHPR